MLELEYIDNENLIFHRFDCSIRLWKYKLLFIFLSVLNASDYLNHLIHGSS